MELTSIGLICSILSLSTWNLLLQGNNMDLYINKIRGLNFIFQSEDFTVESLLNTRSNEAIREIIVKLINVVNSMTRNVEKLQSKYLESDYIKQYLRKFNFFYRYYHISKYPNDFSILSFKEVNMLALRSLFFLCSL